ncbi:MAG: ABC transporter permease [Bacteroidales bacterium]|nr:ABC transporter permease [Bacteroidales bacterium]
MKRLFFFFRVALKYWRSKKSFSIINIISGISFWGIAVGTMALVLVLSAFNGLENMVDGMYNAFHTDFKIEPVNGKYFELNNINTNEIEDLEGVENWSAVIEEIALLRYSDRQKVVKLKGVMPDRGYEERFDTLLIDGRFKLQRDSIYFAIPGAGVFYDMGMVLCDQSTVMTFYAPKRTSKASSDLGSSFVVMNAMPKGYFSVQQEFDDNYVLVSYDLCAQLFDYEGRATSLEIYTTPDTDIDALENELQNLLGNDFIVKNRYEQEEALYKIMKSEKLIVFVILAFIILITSFNLISTLTLVILDKRKNLAALHAMGARVIDIRRIFLMQGILIGFAGLLLGLIIGLAITWAQLKFSLLTMNTGSLAFTAYPVKIVWFDLLYISLTVIGISFFVSLIPIRRISKQWLSLR